MAVCINSTYLFQMENIGTILRSILIILPYKFLCRFCVGKFTNINIFTVITTDVARWRSFCLKIRIAG